MHLCSLGFLSFDLENIRKFRDYILGMLKSGLSDNLYYHSYHHTRDVLNTCNKYIRIYKVSPPVSDLIRIAALMHDTGFLSTYAGHEEASVSLAKSVLPEWGLDAETIDSVSSMIRATMIPQYPGNLAEQILCDSDLDYLGTPDFFVTGNKLYQERKALGLVKDEEHWDVIQVGFLAGHKYFTPYALKHREPVKQSHLKSILNKWNWQVQNLPHIIN